MEHNRTKHCRNMKWLFTFLHILFLFGPFLFFIPYAFGTGETAEKVVLTMTMVVSLIVLVISIIVDITHRAGLHKAVLWMLVGGVIVCIQGIETTFIWIMVAVSLLDELLITPLAAHYKAALIANKEIDKRS